MTSDKVRDQMIDQMIDQMKVQGAEKEMDMDTENQFTARNAIIMDEQHLQENDVIQRYIRRGLSPDELAAFEVLLIANPALIEEIETQRLINAAFKQELVARQYQPGFLVQHAHLLARRILPIAATLVLGLFIGLKSIHKSDPVPAAATLAPVFTATTLVLEGYRGMVSENTVMLSAIATTNVPNSTVNLPLRIDVGPQLATAQRYQLQLIEQGSGTMLATSGSLSASADGWLEYSLQLPAKVRGHYQLQISPLPIKDNGADEQRYLLNFR